jgi:hypothetical protein
METEPVMECDDLRESMLEVLYGEASPETTTRVREHQQACAVCRQEMAGLKRVRRDLKAWSPPSLERPAPSPALRLQPGLGAAAALVLALLGGLIGAQLRRGPGHEELSQALAAQEARHRQELQSLRASLGSAPGSIDDALRREMAELVRASEERQIQRLESSLQELDARSESQRRIDLARVAAGLSYLDGRTGRHVARTGQLMNYVLQASQAEVK